LTPFGYKPSTSTPSSLGSCDSIVDKSSTSEIFLLFIEVTMKPLVMPEFFHLPLFISLTWAPPSISNFSLSSLGTSANTAPSMVKELDDATTSVVPKVFFNVALRVLFYHL